MPKKKPPIEKENILDHKPAPYPETDSSEMRAINALKNLISSQSVKVHIAERDKIPNYDGFLEIVDEGLSSKGKIDVQVKHLSKGDKGRRAFSCDLGFLAYCANSSLPVLLIGVAPEKKEAYWVQITRELAQALDIPKGQRSATVKFPPCNTIKEGTDSYSSDWRRIVEVHSERLHSFDRVKAERDDLEYIRATLEDIGTGLPGKDGIDYGPAQEFLEELNSRLNSEFSVVKRSFFSSGFKVGLALGDYTTTSVSFSLFGRKPGVNDLEIKHIPKEKFRALMDRGYELAGYFVENPIQDRPIKFARELIGKRVEKLIENEILGFRNDALVRELVFTVTDAAQSQMGLQMKNSYTIDELLYGLYVYLPLWIEEVLKRSDASRIRGLQNSLARFGYVDLGSIDFSARSIAPPLDLKLIDREVRKRAQSGERGQLPFPINIKGTSLRQFETQVKRLSLEGANSVTRLYRPFNFKRTGGSAHLIYDWLSPEDTFENLRIFYENISLAFDDVVKENFPKLRGKLPFFDNYEREYVVLHAKDKYDNFHEHPSIEFFGFYREGQPVSSPRIQVFRAGDAGIQHPPEDFDTPVMIDGQEYMLRHDGSSVLQFLFEKQPLYKEILKELKNRFKNLDDLLAD